MRKIEVLFAFFIACGVLADAPDPKEIFRRGPGMWEAFSYMSDAERAELMKLQRDDPEKFRAELEARAEKIYREKLARYEEMQKIVDDYAATADETEKAALKARLREKLADGFDRRLAHHRRQAAAMKLRAESIEKELDRRAGRRDEILDAHLDALLSGEEKLRTPRRKLKRPDAPAPAAPESPRI